MIDVDVSDWLDLLVLVNWAWLLVNSSGLIYAVRSQIRRQQQEDERAAEPVDQANALAILRAEVKRIISEYRLRKGRRLIAALALNAAVGVVAVIMVPPVRPQVTVYFLITAGAMLTSGLLLASLSWLTDQMDLAVERYLHTHPIEETDQIIRNSAIAQADRSAISSVVAANEAIETARRLHEGDTR